MCHHFIRGYVDDGTVKINFFRSEENMEDLFTKNLSNGPFESFTSRYVNHEQYLKNNYRYFNHAEAKHPTLLRKGVRG